MKKTVSLIGFIILSGSSFSQQLDGTWEGAFYTSSRTITRVSRFLMELKQDGRTVWGDYRTSDSSDIRNMTCLNSIAGELSKKPTSVGDLYKERVEYYDKTKVGYSFCNYLNRLALHFFSIDQKEYITGRWFTEIPLKTSDEGFVGVFVLYRTDPHSPQHVDQYFPKLQKKIKNRKPAENANTRIVFDNLSAASPMEKQLLNVIRGIKEKQN